MLKYLPLSRILKSWSYIYIYMYIWYAQIHIWVNVPVHVNLKYVSIHRYIHFSQYVHKSCQQKSIHQQKTCGSLPIYSRVHGILPVEHLTRTICRQLNIHNFPPPTPPKQWKVTVQRDRLLNTIKHVIFLLGTVTRWGLNPNNISIRYILQYTSLWNTGILLWTQNIFSVCGWHLAVSCLS